MVITDQATVRIQILCATCGSPEVSRDATARWNVGLQDWVLAGVQDQATCEACGGAVGVVEAPLR